MTVGQADAGSEHSQVQFGIFDWIDSSGADVPDIYEQRLKMLELADSSGFFCYHLAEHQLTPLSLVPSPSLFLSAAIQRTRRLHLGPMGYLLPIYNPIRLIQEICMLDQMSRGRMEIGVGRGISALELAFYNVDAAESRDIFREALDIVATGLATGVVSHEGAHYRFNDVRFQIRPYQHPYPPFWYPTNYPESFPFMAQHAMNTLLHRVTAEQAAEMFEDYRTQMAQYRDNPGRLNAHVPETKLGLVRLVHVAETDEAAMRQARASFDYFQGNMGFLARTRGATTSPGVQVRRMEGFDEEAAQGRYIAGSPATVLRQVQEQVRLSGCNYFVGAFATGNMTDEQVLTSLSLFARHVMPAFQTVPTG